jgi:hypothetical protein
MNRVLVVVLALALDAAPFIVTNAQVRGHTPMPQGSMTPAVPPAGSFPGPAITPARPMGGMSTPGFPAVPGFGPAVGFGSPIEVVQPTGAGLEPARPAPAPEAAPLKTPESAMAPSHLKEMQKRHLRTAPGAKAS